MTLAIGANGTQTAAVGTAHTLATITGPKTCVLLVDLTNLASGDTVELKTLVKVLAGSTATAVHTSTISGAQTDPVALSVPYPAMHQAVFTLKQTAGTGRAFPWSVVTLD